MKFKVFIEYAGTNYSGWQKQPGQSDVKTVQGTLAKAMESALKKTKGKNKFIDLQGAGRTDAGVHAIQQVAHLECETMLAPEILKMKINDELPSDINILEIEKAQKNFHARHDAKSRQYLYVISKRRTALEKRFVWWIKDKLDIKRMKEAAKLFTGMHDFRMFADKTTEDLKAGKSTKCLVESLEITDTSEKIFIRIKASHFLWKMVRRIAGALVEAGRGNVSVEDISRYLASGNRPPLLVKEGSKSIFNPAEFTAPPSGLFLEKIFY